MHFPCSCLDDAVYSSSSSSKSSNTASAVFWNAEVRVREGLSLDAWYIILYRVIY